MTYTEFKKAYSFTIRTAPDASALYGLETIGKLIKITFDKVGANWHKVETETTEATAEAYLNTVESVPFFRGLGGFEKIERKYTKYGLIPYKITSISPDRKKRIVYKFEI